MTLDLTLHPLYRIHGQEPAALPGVTVVQPPRKTARGREQDLLAVQLLLTGNATFSVNEYAALTALAGAKFHQSPGPMTSALKAAAEAINSALLERNLSTSSRGQYAIGWLALAAVRETHCTLLLTGPMHAFILGKENRHIFEPGLSGRGLGVAQSLVRYFTQAELRPGDRVLLMGKVPAAWESVLADPAPATLDVLRRRLLGLTSEDLHAVLLQAKEGSGNINLLRSNGRALTAAPAPVNAPARGAAAVSPAPQQEPARAPVQEAVPQPEPAPEPEQAEAEMQPSAYAIPPQEQRPEAAAMAALPAMAASREFPPSIPRAGARVAAVETPAAEAEVVPSGKNKAVPAAPREPSQLTRQAARTAVGGIRAWRNSWQRLGDGMRRALPRVLPGNEAGQSAPIPAYVMGFIALVIPVLVVTAAMMVYLRFGRSAQYENYFAQAQNTRAQAVSLSDAIMQRDAWQSVLLYVEKAESYRHTPETEALRAEAEGRLDGLLGVIRLDFQRAFSKGLGIEISRMAATDSDLYLLDARTGEILHATYTAGRGFQKDTSFDCKPGPYTGYQVGPLVDILALERQNFAGASVVGVDAGGNLLYCAPNQVSKAIPLPPPDTNWGRVTAITYDAGNLYVLDAPSRAVWVYTGKESAFIDRPYFFFTEQIPEIQDGIDLVVKDDSLYLLHADGHLSTCSYSRIETVPTRCQDPAALLNPYAAYKDSDLFAQAHITQIMYTSPPDSTILLLGADSQGVLRLTPSSLELQNQIKPAAGKTNPLPAGPIDAMTTGPNHILYLAIKDQVYYAANMP